MKQRTMIAHDKNGNEMTVKVRGALPVNSPCARYTGYKPEKLLLKKGSIRLKGYMPLPCDIILERDMPVKLRDGVTIYTDIFRPNDDLPHPAIMAMSPYGKEIGSQWLDDTPNHAGIPMEVTSGLQKFEGPDPAYWCNHGYAIINPDIRGAYHSEGIILFFGSDYGRDGAELERLQAERTTRTQQDKKIALFIRIFKKLPDTMTGWDDTIWTVMVEKAIVHRDGGVTFAFKNGTEINVGA